MGQTLSQSLPCECFEQLKFGSLSLGGAEAEARKERVHTLQKGGTFMRSILLGMTSQKLFVRLSDDTTCIQWKTEPGSWNQEHGEVDLLKVRSVKATGNSGIQFISNEIKVLLEIQAEDSGIRDQWIVAISDILNMWESDPKNKPTQSSASAAGTSNKTEYFKQREKEMAERQKQREELRKKYAAGGMAQTAQIMASRA